MEKWFERSLMLLVRAGAEHSDFHSVGYFLKRNETDDRCDDLSHAIDRLEHNIQTVVLRVVFMTARRDVKEDIQGVFTSADDFEAVRMKA